MRTMVFASVLVAVTAFACLAQTAAPAGGITLYVSPVGNDGWSGKLAEPNAGKTDGPLATVQGARDAIRRLRAAGGNPAMPARVLIRGGTYFLAEPWVLEPQDSGTPDAPVVYAAYPGEKPVLSGGAVIGGWAKGAGGWTKGAGGVWTAPCPWAVGDKAFKQLWVNGRRRTRARTPNDGYFTIAAKAPVGKDAAGKDLPLSGTSFVFAPGEIKKWPDMDQAVVVVLHSWETSLLRVAAVDEAKRLVTFTGPAAWHFEYWGPGQRYYVENVREALDAPGEWWLDHKSGLLHYLPAEGEDMATAVVVAPRLARLVEFRGHPAPAGAAAPGGAPASAAQAGAGQYVTNIRLEGLTFSHQDYVLPRGGHSDAQAAVSVEAAVMADGVRSCVIEGCEIRHVGGYGLWLRRGCKDCRVVRSRLCDLGAGGVRVGEAARAAADELESSRNVVDNNHIHDGGNVYAAGVGVWVAQSSGNLISHNDIHDLNYSGMSIGWNWDDAPNRTHHNAIEHNHVHHVMRGMLSDGGAIYTLGVSTGSVIRQNHFHDVWSYKQPPLGWGVYLDSTTGGYLVENNVVYNTTSGGFMCSNGGHENVVRNNIFALHANHTLWPCWHVKGNTFRRNIVYLTQGTVLVPFTESTLRQRLARKEPLGDWDENVYWHAGGADKLRFFRMTWEQWRGLGLNGRGLDGRSIVADPLFADLARYDFRLRDDSPARKLGIESIDVSKAGLYGEAAWVDEARRLARPPLPLPPPAQPPAAKEVADDFESTPPGAPPRDAVVSGLEQGAYVRVTAERAAGGKQSLKIQDAKAVEPSWQPHFYYQPHLRGGSYRQAFDIYLQPQAVVIVEWRDDVSGYPQCIGPSVRLEAGGKAAAGGKALTDVPASTWLHVEIECEPKAGTFALALTPSGGARGVFAGLPLAGKEFKELHWAGFISVSAADTAFYVDNMAIRGSRQFVDSSN